MKYKTLTLVTVVTTTLFVALFIFLNALFGEQILLLGNEAVEKWGGLALFSTFTISALVIIPLPDHAVSGFAFIGGMNFYVNMISSTLGSIFGATIAFFLGGRLRDTLFIKKLLSKHQGKWQSSFDKFGLPTLVIASLTPAPFSPMCWICGTMRMKYVHFILIVAICRFLKVTIFLLLLKVGTINF